MPPGNITLKRTDSADPDFHSLVVLLDQELNSRYGQLMQSTYDRYNHIVGLDTVLLAYRGGTTAGCVCFKKYDEAQAEVKRMFVKPGLRGLGIAYQLLSELERWAKESGFKEALLETGNKQHEAIGLYQKLGYQISPNYGPYSGLETSICMRKEL